MSISRFIRARSEQRWGCSSFAWVCLRLDALAACGFPVAQQTARLFIRAARGRISHYESSSKHRSKWDKPNHIPVSCHGFLHGTACPPLSHCQSFHLCGVKGAAVFCSRDWNNEHFQLFPLKQVLISPHFIFPRFYPNLKLSHTRTSPFGAHICLPGGRQVRRWAPDTHGQHQPRVAAGGRSPRYLWGLSSLQRTGREEQHLLSFQLFFHQQGSSKCCPGHGGDASSTQLHVPPSVLRQNPGSCLWLSQTSAHVQHVGIWLGNNTKEISRCVSKMAAD